MSLVLIETDARGVATVVLNRPEKHNAFNGELIRELQEGLLRLQADEAVRVVVLTGAGASFCAGGDIAHMRSMMDASEDENVADALALAHCLRTLDELDRPVIARINGNAFGGGVGLAACADIVVAASTARFTLSEVRLGLVPAAISPYVIAAIGPRHARRLFLTAAPFDVAEAQRIGLVHLSASPEQLDALVAEQVELILRGGPHAVRAAKQLIRTVLASAEREALAVGTAHLLARLRVSPEGREGLSAFLERRTATWVKPND